MEIVGAEIADSDREYLPPLGIWILLIRPRNVHALCNPDADRTRHRKWWATRHHPLPRAPPLTAHVSGRHSRRSSVSSNVRTMTEEWKTGLLPRDDSPRIE